MVNEGDRLLEAELAYHEKLYSGFAQEHFAKPAVRALRRHVVDRICRLTNAGPLSRVLSLGCGIGDTELLLAPRVAEIIGVDLSPKAVEQACADAARLGQPNARFIEGTAASVEGAFDLIIAIFFLHHLQDRDLEELPNQVWRLLKPRGIFYSLDPNARRLSGAVGRLLIPGLMKKYQTEGERELSPEATAGLFRRAGFEVRSEMYDFGSSPLAGLFPGWRFGYVCARRLDDWLLRVPVLRRIGSNFEIIARRP
ncbi:MAG: methyltransferase domain-containing protein [Rhodospirillales bacterium]